MRAMSLLIVCEGPRERRWAGIQKWNTKRQYVFMTHDKHYATHESWLTRTRQHVNKMIHYSSIEDVIVGFGALLLSLLVLLLLLLSWSLSLWSLSLFMHTYIIHICVCIYIYIYVFMQHKSMQLAGLHHARIVKDRQMWTSSPTPAFKYVFSALPVPKTQNKNCCLTFDQIRVVENLWATEAIARVSSRGGKFCETHWTKSHAGLRPKRFEEAMPISPQLGVLEFYTNANSLRSNELGEELLG